MLVAVGGWEDPRPLGMYGEHTLLSDKKCPISHRTCLQDVTWVNNSFLIIGARNLTHMDLRHRVGWSDFNGTEFSRKVNAV